MAENKIPTVEKIQNAIKSVAKQWSDRSGMSSYSWATEVTSKLGFARAEYNEYQTVRRMVEDELGRTSFLKRTSVCGSTALSVKPGTAF